MNERRPEPEFTNPLVTGATGFIGMRLCVRLSECGARPVALVRPSSNNDSVNRLRTIADVQVLDDREDALDKAFPASAPDIVFHLAARYIATHQPQDVPGLVEDNVGLTARVCEALAGSGCRNLIYAGTAWQNAGSAAGDPTPSPNTLYAATKQAGDEIIDYYARTRDLNAITLKIYDSYGPGDPRRKFLNVLAETAAAGETLRASPGDQRLHTVHVDDLVDGFVHAGNLATAGELSGRHSHTLPSPEPITLRELADTWIEATGKTAAIEWGAMPHRPGEVMEPWEGVSLPGWKPRIALKDGLRTLGA